MLVLRVHPPPSRLVGLALVLLSASGYAWLYVLVKWAYAAQASTSTVLVVRFSVAAALLWGWILLRGRALPPRPQTLSLLGLGIVFSGNAYTMFVALERIPVSTAALLLYTYPAMVTLLAATVLRQPLNRRHLVALALATFGGWLTVRPDGMGADLPGIGLALASAAIYSLYILLSSRAVRGVRAECGAALVITAAALVNGVVGLGSGELRLDVEPAAWLSMLGIALFSTVLALGAFLAGVARIGPAPAAITSTFEPVFALFLAAVLLGEVLAPVQLAGAGLILTAVVALARASAEPGR